MIDRGACSLREQCDADRKDAERYRKIKHKASPFMVINYGSRMLSNYPDKHVLTPELDALLDEWNEDG